MATNDDRRVAQLRALEKEIDRREARLVNAAAMGNGGGDGGGGYGIMEARRINEHALADGELARLKKQAAALRRELGPLARRPSLLAPLRDLLDR